jgi:hypothetical protein
MCERETHTQADRQTDRQAGRQTDIEIGKSDRQKYASVTEKQTDRKR